MIKKHYLKPELTKISLDYTVTILFLSDPPTPEPVKRPPPEANGKSASDPFASPFGDKPFN
jgi:hypothetical protein